MSAQLIEQGEREELLRADEYVRTEVLDSIDGVRGTWSWMLESGNHGYGLIPFIVDLEYWDLSLSTSSITKDAPVVVPAFVRWDSNYSLGNLDRDEIHYPGPLIRVTEFSTPFNGADPWVFIANFAEADPYEPDFAIPVWSVTPVDENFVNKWAPVFKDKWSKEINSAALSLLLADAPHEYTDYNNKEYNCYVSSNNCVCGLQEEIESLDKTIYSTNNLWVPTDYEFEQVWSWTISRWVRAWNEIGKLSAHLRERNDQCLYSLVSWHSPYSRILDSEDLMTEIERMSLTHSTSFQHSLESSTEPSPQLTLFDT